MSDTSVIDYGKSKIKAAKFIGEMDGSVAASDVTGLAAAVEAAVAAKTEIAALAALDAQEAELADAVAAINLIIAALKA